MNPENPPPASVPPPPPPKIFSDAEARAALTRLNGKAAAHQAAAAAAPPPAAPQAVEMAAEELAANPEEASRRFDAIIADLRVAFAKWVAAKGEQFEQVIGLGWSGEHGDAASFLKHLEQETEHLYSDSGQTHSDISSTEGAMELGNTHDRLEEMKSIWQQLHAEGVPRNQWPLDAGLTWVEQFQAQAEVERDREKRKP